MIFGRSKKKKNEEVLPINVEKTELSIGDRYLDCANRYIAYQGKLRCVDNPLDDKEFYQKWAGCFYNAAMHFVNYLETTYPDASFENDNVINLDLEDMLENADDTTKGLFFKPKFRELIYINDCKYFTHFHTDGNVVFEAEGVEALPGLSRVLANNKINKLFEGLTPIEVRELLKQMNIYPKDTELDKVIDDYYERLTINQSFLKAVIYLLLIRRSSYGVKRARLFADSLGIYFDFKPFEKSEEQNRKHVL